MKKKNIFAILFSLVALAVVAAVIAFVMYYTNNFSTDLTTFFVQYGSQELRRDTGKMQFEKGVYYSFKTKYPLGFPSSEKGERYHVGVEVTDAGKEIEYKVDGSVARLYKSPDISGSFEIKKSEDGFTFCIPKGTTLTGILRAAYVGKEVTDVPAVDLTAKDYFALVVKSYDEKTVIRIGFGFDGKYWSGNEPAPPDGGDKPIDPENPDVPEGHYTIGYKVTGTSVNEDSVLFQSALTALPDTEQSAAIGIKAEYAESYEILGVYLGGADGSKIELTDPDSDGIYYFTMPECNVTVTVSIRGINGAGGF